MDHIQEAFETYVKAKHPGIDAHHLDLIKPTGILLHFIKAWGDFRHDQAIMEAADSAEVEWYFDLYQQVNRGSILKLLIQKP